MQGVLKAICSVALVVTATLAAAAGQAQPQAQAQAPAPALAFRIDEGQNLNSFLRDGPVAAHLLLRSGTEPRILVAFPAGNSGIGLWFEKTATPVAWTLVTPPQPLTTVDESRRLLHGIEFEVTIDARELRPRGAVLSSVRVLRDYELQSRAPPEVLVAPRITDGSILGLWFEKTSSRSRGRSSSPPGRSRCSTNTAGVCTASSSKSTPMRPSCGRAAPCSRRCACCATTNCRAGRRLKC